MVKWAGRERTQLKAPSVSASSRTLMVTQGCVSPLAIFELLQRRCLLSQADFLLGQRFPITEPSLQYPEMESETAHAFWATGGSRSQQIWQSASLSQCAAAQCCFEVHFEMFAAWWLWVQPVCDRWPNWPAGVPVWSSWNSPSSIISIEKYSCVAVVHISVCMCAWLCAGMCTYASIHIHRWYLGQHFFLKHWCCGLNVSLQIHVLET